MSAAAQVRGLVVGPVTGGAPVVAGVDLDVARGAVLGLAGRSGSGKTTLALALFGYVRPGLVRRAGTVTVAGIDPFSAAGARRVRGRAAAFLGQDPAAALDPRRRLDRQLADVLTGAGAVVGRAAVRAEVARLVAAVGLAADPNLLRRRAGEISGGQAQRIAFAMALAGRPELLVLDEPTAALDPAAVEVLRELIAAQAAARAVLVVSHDRGLLAELAAHTVVLQHGRVATSGPTRVVLPAAPPRPSSPAAPPSAPVLAVRGLAAAYGRRAVLHGIDLQIGAGECVALVGPSGSGKSTVAACVLGWHGPTAGRVLLDGAPLAGTAARRTPAQRRAVGLVAQDSVDALNPHETVAVALGRPLRHLRGLTAAAAELAAAALLDRVALPSAVAGRRPSALSGGERQRVNLARALAAAPRVLVCDEITSALDRDVADAVLDLLAALRRDLGLAVLLISHDADVVASAAHRSVVLDAGRVRDGGTRLLSQGAAR